jgi:predicted  nucleic acid-binding Zn-ribbon protein
MLPSIEQLLILQDKDQLLRRLQAEMKRMPLEEARAKAKLESDTATVAAAKLKVQENEVAIKNLELQIGTRRDTIAKLKFQQFETRKNDEYQALGNEVIRYEGDVRNLEDQELELMEKAETLKAVHAETVAALQATQARVDEELAQIAKRKTALSGQEADTQALRNNLAEKADGDLLEVYDRIFKHRGDAAVVAIEGNVCRGCHMKVAPACLVGAKAEKNLTYCSNCGRIVYFNFS